MGDEPVVDIENFEDLSGQAMQKGMADKLYGGDAKARDSMCNVLFKKRGSVIIRVIPVSFIGALFAFVLVFIRSKQPDLWLLPELKHPFVVQIYSIVLSFVIVARTKTALARYFSGFADVHNMSSRWVDAFTSLLGFLRASSDLHPPGSPKQEACVAVGLATLHWGTLAHALAINSLQVTQLGLDEAIWEHRIQTMDPPENLNLDSDAKKQEMMATISGNGNTTKSRSRLQKGAMTGAKRVSISAEGLAVEKKDDKQRRALTKLGVFGKVSEEERVRLHGATDKVAIVLMWMEEVVSRAQMQGVILVNPPILGRVYAELGNGLMGFNSAYRIALVPFPFCFAQMIGWCLAIFLFLCPAVAFVFTGGEALTSCLTFCSLMGFWGLNRIAIELENPFGCMVNHLPLAEMHHTFIEALGEMHQHPMPEYAWKSGEGSPNLPQLRRNLASK